MRAGSTTHLSNASNGRIDRFIDTLDHIKFTARQDESLTALFAERTEGFVKIEVWDLAEPVLQVRENLVGRWLILGAILGCVGGILFVLYKSAMDAYVGVEGKET